MHQRHWLLKANGPLRLPPRWQSVTIVLVYGNLILDLAASPPADDAALDLFALAGNILIKLPAGAPLALSGFLGWGQRQNRLNPTASGPAATISIMLLAGNLMVVEHSATDVTGGYLSK